MAYLPRGQKETNYLVVLEDHVKASLLKLLPEPRQIEFGAGVKEEEEVLHAYDALLQPE